jgi:hypothetical protein
MRLSVVDPFGLGVIDDYSPATHSGKFYHRGIQKSSRGQPNRDDKKYFR